MISERGQMGGWGPRGCADEEGVEYGRGGRGNISIWGSATATEYRGAHYRRQPTTLRRPDHPLRPLARPPLRPSAKRSHYLLLEETFCSERERERALCNIASPAESRDYSEPIDDREIAAAFPRFATPCAVQIARGCTMSENLPPAAILPNV